jgi:hypothetical protein
MDDRIPFFLRVAVAVALACVSFASGLLGQAPDMNHVLFRQDFRGKGINFHFLQTTGPAEQIEERADGLVIRLPGTIKAKAVGVKTTFPIKGDFELTGSYEFLRLDMPTGKDYAQVGVAIYFKTASDGGEAAQLTRCNNVDASTYRCVRIFTDKGGKRQFQPQRTLTKALSGQLRLVRRGDVVSYSVKEEGNADFRELRQNPISPNDLEWAQIVAETDGATPVEVRILDFQIRGNQEVKAPAAPEKAAPEAPSRSRFLWLAIVVAVLIVLFGVGLWYRRRKQKAN